MTDKKKTLVFIDREGKPGGGKGLLISRDKTFTLSGLRQHLLVYEDGVHTDRQTERVQGETPSRS